MTDTPITEDRVREICREEITKADRIFHDALGAGIVTGMDEASNAVELLMLKAGFTDQAAVLGEVLRLAREQEAELRAQLGLEIPDDISQLDSGSESGEA